MKILLLEMTHAERMVAMQHMSDARFENVKKEIYKNSQYYRALLQKLGSGDPGHKYSVMEYQQKRFR